MVQIMTICPNLCLAPSNKEQNVKIRSQVGMVLNLDKCIGCHTCSVTCKNVWTSREGVEYAWFNNVETKPGVGYPHEWENQERWKGGWIKRLLNANEMDFDDITMNTNIAEGTMLGLQRRLQQLLQR